MPYIANLQEDNCMTKKLTHLASSSEKQGKPVVSMRGATNTHETDIIIYTQKYKSNGLRETGRPVGYSVPIIDMKLKSGLLTKNKTRSCGRMSLEP